MRNQKIRIDKSIGKITIEAHGKTHIFRFDTSKKPDFDTIFGLCCNVFTRPQSQILAIKCMKLLDNDR